MTKNRCTACGELHPVAFFNRDRTRVDGRYPQCKSCSRAASNRVYAQDRERRQEKNRQWKRDNAEKHAQINRHWQTRNREKVAAATARWRKAHPEKAREWALNNPERTAGFSSRWKRENRARVRETERTYIAANRGKVRAKNARRRANVLRATPPWVDHELLTFIYSECPPGWHVDHIHPLKGRGSCGLHVPWNLQYLTASENSKKSNKPPVGQEARSYL